MVMGITAWIAAKGDFYQSTEWKRLRVWALDKYGSACMKCGSTQEIQVDHILPRSKFPKLKLCKHNVGILCKNCNLKKSARIEKDYRPARHKLTTFIIKLIPSLLINLSIAVAIYIALQSYKQ